MVPLEVPRVFDPDRAIMKDSVSALDCGLDGVAVLGRLVDSSFDEPADWFLGVSSWSARPASASSCSSSEVLLADSVPE